MVAAEGLQGEALGALLRREGIYEARLKAWRDAAGLALGSPEVLASGPLPRSNAVGW